MPVSRFIPAFTFAEDRLAALKALAPEAFNADGRLDCDALKIALGEVVEDGATESFGLNWPGKRAARRLALTPVHKTLAPAPGEGVDEASTRNIFIEGDNLDALKLLRKAYAGRVKMIYIDPPYNTGNDFIYKDDFRESAEEYQQKTGQRGEEGERMVANPKSSGRFHSNWLSMIYPRLLLARDLLREDGVIFVSIDDNEVHNLRQVMDEVFGAENFIATIVWQAKDTPGNDSKEVASTHNYVIAYRRSVSFAIRLLARTENQVANYKNPDNDPRGPWLAVPLTRGEYRQRDHYALINPTGNEVFPPAGNSWRRPKAAIEQLQKDGRLWWGKKGDSTFPSIKQFLSETKEGVIPITWWDYKFGGSTRRARSELKDLFDGDRGFDTPKPTQLIRKLLDMSVAPDEAELVMDFFAGSATTAHAVMDLNAEDGGNRCYVLAQAPETTGDVEYGTIADLAKERIRRVVKKLKAEQNEASNVGKQTKLGLDKTSAPAEPLDLGLKVFKIQDSPFKRWADYEGEDIPAYQARLDEAADHPLRPGWVAEAVLTEIALQEGFPLDSAMAVLPEFKRNAVRRVNHESSQHRLFVCLDDRILADTIASVRLEAQDIFICFDHALGDEAKLRLADVCKLKVI